MAKKDIKTVLYNLMEEFMAEGAWCGHCYGFENMGEYYRVIVDFMKKNKLNCKELVKSYEAVTKEYNRLLKDKTFSFLNPDDPRKIDYLAQLDKDFLSKLAYHAQIVVDFLGIKDDYLVFWNSN